MDNINQDFLEKMFSPLRVTFSNPRPDGGIVLSLLDDNDATSYSRVLTRAQRGDPDSFAQTLENIRLELAMRSGSIPSDLRKALKEQDSLLTYQAE
ncbi:DUF3509 domain-containing protein [Pseudomonas sp. TTU2014-080ASC]|uniref:DUF3509 domain-containing protein n=1 Tax=Pseudomonas sp. TTU2014-080ASC TaxID=1729724 RepID=UPI0007183B6A|nr:DUF3509 domain-containing protein [Pseudomonas sp. TTU2014-080ASC]KRW59965.1 hypothetical protein AO726_14400 [Pseudomonas sp. TTU2014-080ASC]